MGICVKQYFNILILRTTDFFSFDCVKRMFTYKFTKKRAEFIYKKNERQKMWWKIVDLNKI